MVRLVAVSASSRWYRKMRIIIETIPHDTQRYETCGDWKWDGDDLYVKVSDTGNDDHALLVGVHEIIEAYLCKKHGIDEAAVTAFDMAFEASRPEDDDSEPGDDFEAPYHHEHMMASDIEKYVAEVIHADWSEYEKAIGCLKKTVASA